LRGLNKPVIAAVNGIACGGGLELALSADIILAAEHATFALPEIRSGTVADAASIKLPKRIPYHIAMELLLTGRWFDAEEAARWGLVNRILPAGELMAEARKMADDLAAGPPLVFAAIKEIVREAEDMKFQDALNRITGSQFETVERLYRSEDQLEGRARLCRRARSGLEGSIANFRTKSVRSKTRKGPRGPRGEGRTDHATFDDRRSSSPVP
jgi:crotonobetainyl-CoA hydratase